MTSALQEESGGPAVPEWTLGWRLQRALAFAGVRVEEMGAELGVARATISRWMHDKGAPPRAIYVKQWSMRTGVSLEWLETGGDVTIGGSTRRLFPASSLASRRLSLVTASTGDYLGVASTCPVPVAAAENHSRVITESRQQAATRRIRPVIGVNDAHAC